MRWLLVLSLAGLAACSSGDGRPRAERALPEPITVSSPAFAAGSAIPQRFTCDADNLSPPLGWSGVPAGTVESPWWSTTRDAPRGTYVHWILIGLDPASTRLAETTRFTVYALQRSPDVGEDASPEAPFLSPTA